MLLHINPKQITATGAPLDEALQPNWNNKLNEDLVQPWHSISWKLAVVYVHLGGDTAVDTARPTYTFDDMSLIVKLKIGSPISNPSHE